MWEKERKNVTWNLSECCIFVGALIATRLSPLLRQHLSFSYNLSLSNRQEARQRKMEQ